MVSRMYLLTDCDELGLRGLTLVVVDGRLIPQCGECGTSHPQHRPQVWLMLWRITVQPAQRQPKLRAKSNATTRHYVAPVCEDLSGPW